MKSSKLLPQLRGWNLAMALLHAIQGITVLLLSNDFALPVTTSFVEFNVKTRMLEPLFREIASFRIGPMVAAFFFLSAFAHLLLSLPIIYKWYITNIKNSINPARWFEYAFSSSLMMVVIVMLTGMSDAVSLLLIFFLNMAMILFGWMMELHNQKTKIVDWTGFTFGSIAGIVPWIAVALYLFNAGTGNLQPPTFVYWIFFSIFVFSNAFPLNMFLQYKKIGPWRDYVYGERAYLILSLVAKSLLAWQVFAGTLRPL